MSIKVCVKPCYAFLKGPVVPFKLQWRCPKSCSGPLYFEGQVERHSTKFRGMFCALLCSLNCDYDGISEPSELVLRGLGGVCARAASKAEVVRPPSGEANVSRLLPGESAKFRGTGRLGLKWTLTRNNTRTTYLFFGDCAQYLQLEVVCSNCIYSTTCTWLSQSMSMWPVFTFTWSGKVKCYTQTPLLKLQLN